MHDEILQGLLLDEDHRLSLSELSRACTTHAEWIVELVNQGILDPSGRDALHWRFSGAHLRRARIVMRLQRDLGVNLAGAALALDLLQEIETLRGHLRTLEGIDR